MPAGRHCTVDPCSWQPCRRSETPLLLPTRSLGTPARREGGDAGTRPVRDDGRNEWGTDECIEG